MLLKILCAVIARLFLHEAFVFSVCPLLRQISLSYIDLSISYPPLHCLIKSFFYFIWLFLTLPHIYILPLIHLCRPFLLPPFAFFHSFEFLFTKISFLNFWLKIQNLYFGLLCFHPCYLLSYTLLFVYSHLFTLTILHTLSLSLSLSLNLSTSFSFFWQTRILSKRCLCKRCKSRCCRSLPWKIWAKDTFTKSQLSFILPLYNV